MKINVYRMNSIISDTSWACLNLHACTHNNRACMHTRINTQ